MNTEQLILLYLLGAAVYLLLGIFVMRITTTPPPEMYNRITKTSNRNTIDAYDRIDGRDHCGGLFFAFSTYRRWCIQ